jgi:hypothetical protein
VFFQQLQVSAAAEVLDVACAAQNVEFWPHVMINGAQAGGANCTQDSCVIPVLPVLCKAYTGAIKPKSCGIVDKLIAQGLVV